MKKITKIESAIKRKVKENRLRRSIRAILNNSLPSILAEMDQLDQAFLDAKPVKEEEDLEELDVRKTHGDKRIENPATGNDIKLRTALKAKKGSAVYAKGKSMYNALKDEPTNERAYASTDGKPYFDYDPGKDKLTEARTYRLGDKWSNDFDYKGMLQMGAKTKVSTGLDKLQKLYDSFEDVNYHSEKQDLGNAIDWLEDEGPNHPKAKQFMNRFRQACLKTLRGLKEGKLTEGRKHALLRIEPRNYEAMIDKLQDMNINHRRESDNVIKVYTDRIPSKVLHNLTHDVWVAKFVLKEGKVNESVIGIKTDRDFKGKDLKTALDKAKIKYKMNRLTMTLMVLNLDKKYYDDAKQVVDDLGLNVMTAKESVNEYGGSEFSKITSLQNFLTIDLDKFEKGLKDSKHKAIYKKARKQFMRTVSDVAFKHSKMHESKLTEGRPGTTKKKYDVGDIIWVTIPGAGGGTFKGKVVEIGVVRGKFVYRVKDGRSEFAAHQDEVRGLDEGKALKKVVDNINSDKQPLVEYKKLNKMQAKALVALFGLSILGFTFKAAAAPLFVLFAGAMHINDFLAAKKYVKNNPDAAKQAHLKFDQYDNKIRGFM